MQHVSRFSLCPSRVWPAGHAFRARAAGHVDNGAAFAVTSARGDTRIVLADADGALYVERTQRRRRSRTTTVALFDDLGSFDAWADELPLRFEDPCLHMQIKRHARRLLLAA